MAAARWLWARAYHVASRHRGYATALVYGALAFIAYPTAFLLRFEFAIPPEYVRTLALTVPIVIVLRLVSSYIFEISTARWRYVSTSDVRRLVGAAAAASVLLYAATWSVPGLPAVPRSIIIIDFMLFTCLTCAVWIIYRTAFEQLRARNGDNGAGSRVLIVGAGEAGSMLAREMFRSSIRRQPVGFVDDDPTKLNTMLHGLRVLGSTAQLMTLVERHGVQEIVIAAPSASPGDLRRIVELCEATDLTFKVLPGLSEVLEGRVEWSQVRALRIEDLLGREPVALELPELYGDLQGRSVLITGAAGSIGSELSRQVALHRPATLVLFDQSETALFELGRELEDMHPGVNLEFLVADITDEVAVEATFHEYRPSRVFHAAAYKHVSMMQGNVREAVRNNVGGTLNLAAAAGRYRTEKFVFVSSDKAVCPTSIMGATKRLAEMLLHEVQQCWPATAFASVRFGNVLGSNGSVIPIFRKQIEAGQPLTVTHPDATRYFMMIPEAVQLILQASLLPEVRGQIVMLDMGEPVRIVDLARNLLRIAGRPHKNGNSVVFTGLREGEKLHEVLLAPGETTVPTRIEKVNIVVPVAALNVSVVALLAEWQVAFREGRQADVLSSLVAMFPELNPGAMTAPAVLKRVSA
ncbi:nucleoside-diphosphate sugar epimerase/dehydratase [soil metagenome]